MRFSFLRFISRALLVVAVWVCLGGTDVQAQAQGKKKKQSMPAPVMLLGPEDWRFERLPMPPGFAPEVKWKGFEEARFAPGMFVRGSSNYFTYVFAVSVDGAPAVGAKELKEFLELYFSGLSNAVGQRQQIKHEVAEFKVEVASAKGDSAGAGGSARYEGTVVMFDTFNNGEKVELNLEVAVTVKPGKTYAVFLLSPKGKEDAIWKKLREVGGAVKTE